MPTGHWHTVDGFRQTPEYHSRECGWCGRDYLYPQYGGWAVCNDCSLQSEVGLDDRLWPSEIRRDDPRLPGPVIGEAEWNSPELAPDLLRFDL